MTSIPRAAFLTLAAVFLTCISGISWDNRDSHKPLFRVGVDTVFLRVSVTDPSNRNVTGLSKEDFKVFEDKVQQEISAFTHENSPVSIGILLDTSGSMKNNNNMQAARAALTQFMADVNPGDEFFLITFNQNTSLVKDFTQDSAAILSESALQKPSGQTAIWDAVYRGLDKMKDAKNDKKAIILITDGEDNNSRYTSSEVREFAKESDTQIYVVGEPGDLGYGPAEINSIVRLTGGRAFFPNSLNDLEYYMDLIHAELRNQYVLGYIPSHKNHDGKWRKVQVKLDQPRDLPKLNVRTKEGYYSARN